MTTPDLSSVPHPAGTKPDIWQDGAPPYRTLYGVIRGIEAELANGVDQFESWIEQR